MCRVWASRNSIWFVKVLVLGSKRVFFICSTKGPASSQAANRDQTLAGNSLLRSALSVIVPSRFRIEGRGRVTGPPSSSQNN